MAGGFGGRHGRIHILDRRQHHLPRSSAHGRIEHVLLTAATAIGKLAINKIDDILAIDVRSLFGKARGGIDDLIFHNEFPEKIEATCKV
jgi:hypothetical protein